MLQLYECSIRFNKTQADGKVKKVTELYLVDACSFTEAETRIITEMRHYISGELEVTTIKRTNICEIVCDKDCLQPRADASQIALTDIADKWFKAKIKFITIDEHTAKEKATTSVFIVNAGSINDAHDALVNFMKGVSDYEIVSLDETKIMEVYVYSISNTNK